MADTKATVSVLEKVPLFRSLKKGQLERLAKRFVEREYAAGQELELALLQTLKQWHFLQKADSFF